MRNNERKYREELFSLLKQSYGEINEAENKILEELFLSDDMNNEDLLNRLKDL